LLVQPLTGTQPPKAHCSPAAQSTSATQSGGRQVPAVQAQVEGQSAALVQPSGGRVQTPRSQASPAAQSASSVQSEKIAQRPASQK
jgi:hypothetical protein